MEEAIQTRRFTIDRASYLQAMWSRGLWVPMFRLAGIVTVVLVACAVSFGPAPLQGGLPGLAFALALGVATRYSLARRNVYAKAARKVFDEPRTMAISEWGVHTLTEGGAEGKLPWSYFVSVERRGAFTLLFTGSIIHLIVPDEAFATATDRAAFDALLRRTLAPKPN